MKKIIITKNQEMQKSQRWSFWQKLLLLWTAINLMLAFCLAVYSISTKWGSSTLGLIWLFLLGIYAVVFCIVFLISQRKGAVVLRYRLKHSIIIIKLLTNISNLISLSMTLSMLVVARLRGDMSGSLTILTVITFMLLAILGIIFNVRGYKKAKQKSQKLAKVKK